MLISKKVTLSILSFLLVGPITAHCEEPHYTNGFWYNDQVYHQKVVTELKSNDIPIIISDEGYATYPNSYEQEVTKILKRLDNRPYSEFYKKQYADNFVALLDENNIEYKVKIFSDSKVQVFWNNEDDKLVRKLKEVNLNRIFEGRTIKDNN